MAQKEKKEEKKEDSFISIRDMSEEESSEFVKRMREEIGKTGIISLVPEHTEEYYKNLLNTMDEEKNKKKDTEKDKK